MITIVSYIGILSGFLMFTTVLYLGLLKVKLIQLKDSTNEQEGVKADKGNLLQKVFLSEPPSFKWEIPLGAYWPEGFGGAKPLQTAMPENATTTIFETHCFAIPDLVVGYKNLNPERCLLSTS